MTTSLAVTIVIRNGLVHAVYANDPDLDLVVVDWDVLPDDPHAISIHANGHTLTGVISRPNVESYTGFEQSHEGRLLGDSKPHSVVMSANRLMVQFQVFRHPAGRNEQPEQPGDLFQLSPRQLAVPRLCRVLLSAGDALAPSIAQFVMTFLATTLAAHYPFSDT